MAVSVVTENSTQFGEGPHWDHRSQSLLYVDFLVGQCHRWNFQTGQDDVIDLGGPTSFIIPCKSGGGYVASLAKARKLVHYDWSSRRITKEYGEVHKGTQNFINDGKCDAAGRLWFGTLTGKSIGLAKVDKEKGAVFSLEPSGTLHRHTEEFTMFNGPAWNSTNTIMYYADSVSKKIYASDFNLQDGLIGNQRTVLEFGKGLANNLVKGLPDGMCMDTADKLWLAVWGSGKVFRIDPETGKQMTVVEFPVSNVTSCCFGGPGGQELYVTTSRYGLSKEQLRQQPLAGSVFKVTGLGTSGLPVSDFGVVAAGI